MRLKHRRDIDVMQEMLVGEAMATNVDTADVDLTLTELGLAFQETLHHGFRMLDTNGDLSGVVTIQDLERARERGPVEGLRVGNIARRGVLLAYPDE